MVNLKKNEKYLKSLLDIEEKLIDRCRETGVSFKITLVDAFSHQNRLEISSLSHIDGSVRVNRVPFEDLHFDETDIHDVLTDITLFTEIMGTFGSTGRMCSSGLVISCIFPDFIIETLFTDLTKCLHHEIDLRFSV